MATAMRDEIAIIKAGWLIDGSGAAIQKDVQLTIENGMIRSIQKMAVPEAGRETTAGHFMDLSECTVLPGLIDCHVHLAMRSTTPRNNRPGLPTTRVHAVHDRIVENLKQYLAVGVLAVRDGGDSDASALSYKKNPPGFEVNPVHLCVAGKAWHRAGRYGDLLGRELSEKQTLADAILQEDKAVDHIKIINSDLNSLTHYGRQTAPQFDLDEIKAAVIAARRRGLKTMIHANGTAPVGIAVGAGCDSIEHGFFMGKENMQRMADNGTTWVPTAFTMQALRREVQAKGGDVDVVQRNLKHQIEQIQMALDLRVPIALGTDGGSTGVEHGKAVIREMRLLIDAGGSIEKVVQYASHNCALLLGLQRVGLLGKNMQATLIAVQGDPSHLPESLKQISLILIKGKQINSNNKIIK